MNRAAAAPAGLEVTLDRPLPFQIMAGNPTTIACFGTCFANGQPVSGLEILADGVRHPCEAQGMPRDDRQVSRSGFWATILLDVSSPRTVELEAEARLMDGALGRADLGSIEVVEPPARVEPETRPESSAPLIAICMATYNSDPQLFSVQVESIRAQADADWVCVISDDCSDPEQFEAIEKVVAGDERFILTRTPRRLGFYRNFERLLAVAPAKAELIALSDHDDRWHPDKLAALRAALGDSDLAYSDARLTDASGNVRTPSFWHERRNNYDNLASLLIANTVAGASCLMRRRVAERALPFPETPGWDFHDHWLALVALSTGDLAYVDRPLYDYVQHPRAVLGHRASGAPAPRTDAPESVSKRWRDMYFGAYLGRQLQAGILLSRCEAELTPRKRRALGLTGRASRSPLAFAWLAVRPLRALWGRNEALGFETFLVRGILWRRVISRFRDATPSADSKSLGSRQRRWLTGRG